MTMAMPFWLQIGTPSAWADGFRPSLSARGGLFMSRITFLSGTLRDIDGADWPMIGVGFWRGGGVLIQRSASGLPVRGGKFVLTNVGIETKNSLLKFQTP